MLTERVLPINRGSRWALAFVALIWGLGPASVWAAEVPESGRDVFHCSEENTIEIGDVADHFITVFVCEGMRFVGDSYVASFEFNGSGDYVAGAGREIGYQILTYSDGATRVLRFEGTRTPAGSDIDAVLEGTYEITKGTDRFSGIKGGGSYKGKSFGGNGYLDWTSRYSLP